MFRAVLAVALTAALLGASLPAVDEARRGHTDTAVRSELDRLTDAARDLLDADDPVPGADGARRVVTVSLPEESWRDAGVEAVTVEPRRNGTAGRLTWTPSGGRQQVRRLPDVPLETAGDEPLSLDEAGTHRLVLALEGSPTGPVVAVRRFTYRDGASPGHATLALDPT